MLPEVKWAMPPLLNFRQEFLKIFIGHILPTSGKFHNILPSSFLLFFQSKPKIMDKRIKRY
jgi:hypothetical protein